MHAQGASGLFAGRLGVVRVQRALRYAPHVSYGAGAHTIDFGKASTPVAVVAAAARIALVLVSARIALLRAALPAVRVQPASEDPIGKASGPLAVVTASARISFVVELARTALWQAALWQAAGLALVGRPPADKIGSSSAHPGVLVVPDSSSSGASSDTSFQDQPTSKPLVSSNSSSSSSSVGDCDRSSSACQSSSETKPVQVVSTPAAARTVVKVFRDATSVTSDGAACVQSRAYVRSCLQQCFSTCTPDELRAESKKFQFLGKGSYGACEQLWVVPPPAFSATAHAAGWDQIMLDGVPVVFKRLDCQGMSGEECKHEAAVYRDVSDSRYIPRLLNHSHSSSSSILVFEAVSHSPQNLQDRVIACAAANGNGPKHIPLLQMLSVVRRVSGAMWDLNRKRWCHGDIKPPNIAMGDEGAFVIDLGMAMKMGTHLRGYLLGSPWYVHPEIEYGSKHGEDVVLGFGHDYFSLGLVLAFMLVRGDERRVLKLREIATRVRCGCDYNEAQRGVVQVLGQESKAVVLAHEQQLQQEGLLQPGMAGDVLLGLVELVSSLLLKDVKDFRDMEAFARMLSRLDKKAAGIKQQQ